MNVCSYTINCKQAFGGVILKNINSNLLNRSSLALNKYFHTIFNDEPLSDKQAQVKKVLPYQPIAQRKLFTKLAIADHREIFMQLNPLTTAGNIINCRGQLSKLSNGLFRLKNHNVLYIFSLQQIRYIAG